jgi:hypothetical protein
MMQQVNPKIEFIQGIPLGLEADDYFQPDTNNLIVLDDLMSTASKDSRITDLFTEGSHHRNLSVICINQNLYASKDPTQRRNCQYLVLFKNPIDQQQIATLARQMYPGKSKHFLEEFTKATEKPFSYLLVDLKPTTLESERLRSNVLTLSPSESHSNCEEGFSNYTCVSKPDKMGIKACDSMEVDHFLSEPGTDNTTAKTSVDHLASEPLTENRISDTTGMAEEKTSNFHPCVDCGQVFDGRYDLNRHIRRWCPANVDDCTDDEIPKKKMKLDVSSTNKENVTDSNQGFFPLVREVYNAHQKTYEKKVKYFEDAGMDEDEAEETAKAMMLHLDRRLLIEKYRNILSMLHSLKDSSLHRQIESEISQLVKDSKNGYEEALNAVLKRNRMRFNDVLEDYDEENSEDEDEDRSNTEETSGDEEDDDGDDDNDDDEEGTEEDSEEESDQ